MAGDLLMAVNGEDVQSYRHKEAQDTIVKSGNNLTITVRRGSVLSQALKPAPSQGGRQTPLVSGNQPLVGGGGPGPVNNAGGGEWSKVLDANRAGAAMNAESFTQEFMSQLMGSTASNLPPPLLSDTVVNSNQQQQQNQQPMPQENGVRMATPTQKTLVQPSTQSPTTGPSQSMKNQMNSKQYNSPQPLYSQV